MLSNKDDLACLSRTAIGDTASCELEQDKWSGYERPSLNTEELKYDGYMSDFGIVNNKIR